MVAGEEDKTEERKKPPLCGARNRTEQGTCKRPAGWGTNHVGFGQCKLHGGGTKHGRQYAIREEIEQMGVVMGPAIEVDPHQALISIIHIAAGEVAYASDRVAALSESEAIVTPETRTESSGGEGGAFTSTTYHKQELNLWIQVRSGAMDRLARYSKMALDAGIAQRQVQLAEEYGGKIANVLQHVLGGLDLTPAQWEKAPGLVRSALTVLEGQGTMLTMRAGRG